MYSSSTKLSDAALVSRSFLISAAVFVRINAPSSASSPPCTRADRPRSPSATARGVGLRLRTCRPRSWRCICVAERSSSVLSRSSSPKALRMASSAACTASSITSRPSDTSDSTPCMVCLTASVVLCKAPPTTSPAASMTPVFSFFSRLTLSHSSHHCLTFGFASSPMRQPSVLPVKTTSSWNCSSGRSLWVQIRSVAVFEPSLPSLPSLHSVMNGRITLM